MMIRLIFFISFVQILFPAFGYAQSGFMRPGNVPTGNVPTVQEPQPVSVNSDHTDWNLPSLQTLINHAIDNSPAMKLAETELHLGEHALKDIHREWLRRINFMADARYGTMFDYSRIIPGVPMTPTVMMSYGVGATAGLSLADLFDRKRLKQQARIRIEQTKISKEDVINDVTQMVIIAYYEVLTAQKTLALSNELYLMASMVHDKAKMDFAQNRISMTDWAKENESFLSAQNDVELQKINLMKSIRILEIIVGIELVKTI